MTSQTHDKKGSNLHLDKGEEENSAHDPPKIPKKNPIIRFFQNLINKSVSDSKSGRNSSPKPKRKPQKNQKPAAGRKIDFGIEKTQTLEHFDKPKPPQNRSRPRTMKPRTNFSSSMDGLDNPDVPENEEISKKLARKPISPPSQNNPDVSDAGEISKKTARKPILPPSQESSNVNVKYVSDKNERSENIQNESATTNDGSPSKKSSPPLPPPKSNKPKSEITFEKPDAISEESLSSKNSNANSKRSSIGSKNESNNGGSSNRQSIGSGVEMNNGSSRNSSYSGSKDGSSKRQSISIIGSRASQQSLGSANNLRPQNGSGQKIKSSEESIGSQNRINESDVGLRHSSQSQTKIRTGSFVELRNENKSVENIQRPKTTIASVGSNRKSSGSNRGSTGPVPCNTPIRDSIGSTPSDFGSKLGEATGGLSSKNGSIGSNRRSIGSQRSSIGSNRESIGSKHSDCGFTQRMISHEEKNDGIENPTSL